MTAWRLSPTGGIAVTDVATGDQEAMDALPSEIHCQIVSYLDSWQLLTCRLVSRYWEEVVSLHLARVNHVILNQSLRDDSPIPDILFHDLHSRRFSCQRNGHRLFFEFLRRRCPNLKVFSAVNNGFRVDDFIRLPPGLMYFEADLYSWGREQPLPFPSLIACQSSYCAPCQSNSSVQYSNICRNPYVLANHPSVNTLTPEKLSSLRWFGYYPKRIDERRTLPECPSLEILQIALSGDRCEDFKPFSYPKLKFLSRDYLNGASGPFLYSIQHSKQLRAMELQSVENVSSFLEFASSLQHLQFLKVKWTSDKKISVPLSDSLEHFHFDCSSTSLTFDNPKHDKLRVLYMRCQNKQSISFNFPSLQEIYFYSAYNADEVIDSLYHSRFLKVLDLAFKEAYCTDEQTQKIFQFISDTGSLQKVSVTIRLPKYQEENPFILDISRYHDLTKVNFSIDYYPHKEPPKIRLVVDEHYDNLYTDQSCFILKKTGISYRSCSLVIPTERTALVPVLSSGLSFTKFEMNLNDYKSEEDAARMFGELTSNMPELRHVALSTDRIFHLSLETVKLFLEAIKESLSLESLQLDLSIDAARSNRSNERMVIDARDLHSLHQVNVRLQSDGTEPRHLQLILLLGDFFRELVVADDNSLRGQLVDGQPFEATLPTLAAVQLSRPMSQLKSLTVSNWSLIDDTNEFFEACKSIESLHLNKSDHIRSMIPVLVKLANLKNLGGQLSHTFVKMFLTRVKEKRKLNLHSSLRPIVEKIQKNSKLGHLDLTWFD